MTAAWTWPGARWWRIDLHAHTPKSDDFESGGIADVERWRHWLESARDAGLDAIAITDHNSAEAVSHIKEALSEVTDAPVIFPGVELTASDGTHLLLLLDPSSERQHVEHALSQVGVPVDGRGEQGARSTLSIEQILNDVDDETLVIGAHVNVPEKGILQGPGRQRIEVLRHPRLAAVEIKSGVDFDETWLDGSKQEVGRKVSQVWASDAHCFNDLGRRFTWMKMTRLDLEGLRLALSDGDIALRQADQTSPGDPNAEHASLSIESISVRNGKLIGRSAATSVAFNPWLNVIIGGRGSGKSTLIDFCRKTLRREDELNGVDSSEEGSLRQVFDRRMKASASHNEEGLLTHNTLIEVHYRKDGERFLLSWSEDGTAPAISRLVGEQQFPEEGNIKERFPVRMYSQKQLFTLAQDTNALLTVIDDTQDVRGAESHRRFRQIEADYLALCAEARAASALAIELPARIAALRDVQRKLDVLQQGGYAQILNTYRSHRQADETWKAILQATENSLDLVKSSVDELSVPDLILEAGAGTPYEALRRTHQSLVDLVGAFQQDILDRVNEVFLKLEGIHSGTDANEWRTAVESAAADYAETAARLEREGISDPNEYGDLLDQAARLQEEIQALEAAQRRAEDLKDKSVESLEAYRKEWALLSDRRRAFALDASSNTLQVEVAPRTNYSGLTSYLSRILGSERFESDRTAIVERIVPQADDGWDWCRLDGVVSEIRKFQSDSSVSWDSRDSRFLSVLRRVPPEGVDRLALYLPEDSISVRFKDNRHGSEWRRLSYGSPGQQTAALLAFVLGFGSEPLILDQPEDDLDNTLIYELLVTRFREEKFKRQMIVVTHNPNIVVHGDAEFVVSLNVRHGETLIERQGGLQEEYVRDEICRVMEGGREAFETRYHRIMPPGRQVPW